MSHSRNTEKASVHAARRMACQDDGEVRLPRILVRKPKRGDIHPLSKSMLARALQRIPLEYLYGLTRIELRARHGNGIGAPFGAYRPGDKVVILYSLPMVWLIDWMTEGYQKDLERFGARVSQDGRTWQVRWRSRSWLSLWFFKEIVLHELGHHFAEQYKNKRSRIRGIRFREMNANLHSFRLARAMFHRWKKRRGPKTPREHAS